MAVYRTAQGRMLDMGALVSRHEKTRAVGNMNVNARGDQLDSQGRIVKPVTEKVNERYAKTVGNRSSQVVKQPANVQPKQPPKPELTEAELQFEDDDISDEELQQLKQKENKSTKEKK